MQEIKVKFKKSRGYFVQVDKRLYDFLAKKKQKR